MKIKFKKEMTLDELIKWAWENPELVRGEKFYAQGKSNETYVYFHLYESVLIPYSWLLPHSYFAQNNAFLIYNYI